MLSGWASANFNATLNQGVIKFNDSLDGSMYSVGAEMRYDTSRWRIGVDWFRTNTQLDDEIKSDYYATGLNAYYPLTPLRNWTPYLKSGLAYARSSIDDQLNPSTAVNLGVGIERRLTNTLSFGVGMDGHHSLDDGYTGFAVTSRLTLSFNGLMQSMRTQRDLPEIALRLNNNSDENVVIVGSKERYEDLRDGLIKHYRIGSDRIIHQQLSTEESK